MLIIRYCLFALPLLFPFFLKAQDSTWEQRTPGSSHNSRYGVEANLFVGGQVNNFSGINGVLKAAGIDPVNPGMINGGLGAAFRMRALIIGIETGFQGGFQHNVEVSGITSRLYLSTNSIRSKYWIFSPQVGIAWQDQTVRITQPGAATSFNSALTTSANQVELHNSNTLLDMGMAVKLRIPGSQRNHPFFKLGYRYGLDENQWNVRNSPVTDGPRDRGSNFYFDLLLGIGR